MKRNRSMVRAQRHVRYANEQPALGKSRYARKVQAGNQLYGPGCCAHKVSDSQIAAAKQRAREEYAHHDT